MAGYYVFLIVCFGFCVYVIAKTSTIPDLVKAATKDLAAIMDRRFQILWDKLKETIKDNITNNDKHRGQFNEQRVRIDVLLAQIRKLEEKLEPIAAKAQTAMDLAHNANLNRPRKFEGEFNIKVEDKKPTKRKRK